MDIKTKIESILFVASKPLSVRVIAAALGALPDDVANALEDMKAEYNHEASGVHILSRGDEVQMATNPANDDAVQGFVKQEAVGELTKAQLETLTVVAYRGPVTRPELEQIRGVNCALILRHLLVRGLIEEEEAGVEILSTFVLSFDALRYLGIHDVSELPDYAELHKHEHIKQALEEVTRE